MLPCRLVIVGLIYCCIKPGVAHHGTKDIQAPQRTDPSDFGDPLAFPLAPPAALFPAARRIKRGVANVVNPTFHKSFDDVHLLFEILLAGIHFEGSGEISVQDAELASLRKTKNLEVICEEIIPRKLTDIYRLISDLSDHIGPLHQDDFERILLTLVYSTQQMVNSTTEHQRSVWEESFVSLYKAIKQDLTGTT